MCVYINTRTYIHAYIHTYIHTSIHIYIYTSIRLYIYTSIHLYIYTYIHIYIYAYIHIYIYTCKQIYIYINTCLYVYMYVFIEIHTHERFWEVWNPLVSGLSSSACKVEALRLADGSRLFASVEAACREPFASGPRVHYTVVFRYTKDYIVNPM